MTVKEKIDRLYIENKILQERLDLLREMIQRNIIVVNRYVFYFDEDFNAKRLINIIDGKREDNNFEYEE